MMDTNSDGAHLGLSEDEDDNAYKPPGHEDDEDEGGGDASGDSMVQLRRNRQKRLGKKKKVSLMSFVKPEGVDHSNIQEKEKLQAEVQAHHQVAPMVYAHPDPWLLDRKKGEQGKKTKYMCVGGCNVGWQNWLLTDQVEKPQNSGGYRAIGIKGLKLQNRAQASVKVKLQTQ